MATKSTAKKIRDLPNYVGDVALYELSKGIKKGKDNYKHIVVARYKPRSGTINTSVWLVDKDNVVTTTKPHKDFVSSNLTDAFDQLGYRLV